ncbi:MAG: cupin domain-containing protein [Chromatiaceae bacterium]
MQHALVLLVGLALLLPVQAIEQTKAVKVSTVLKTQTSWDGQPLQYPAGDAEVTGMLIEIAPGGETGWHLHPVPSFGMVVQGELEVSLKDGRTKRMKAGDALAEVVHTAHNGRNVGTEAVKLVVFYAGSKGLPLSQKIQAEPKAKH